MTTPVRDLRSWLRRMPAARETVHRYRRLLHPVDLGNIRQTRPVSNIFGFDRGLPVGRYYIERFLAEHRQDIHGRILEVMDSSYTRRYGHAITGADVLDIDAANPLATVVADLAHADSIPSESYDCFILTQTLQYIYDSRAALTHAQRMLRPGGVLLAVLPSVSRMDPTSRVAEYWRFTAPSCARLFGEVFGSEQVTISPLGNMLTCVAALLGMAAEELSARELEAQDLDFPLDIGVRAVRAVEQPRC